MALKFLVDVGVGRAVENILRSLCYDMKAVRDIDTSAKDCDILDIAVREGRMIITMDKDFGELVHKLTFNPYFLKISLKNLSVCAHES